MRRRLLFILAGLCAGAVLLVATLPWWAGAVARRVGPGRGLTFGAYERIGYSRFALHDVVFRRANVRVTVARVEADTPALWLWRHWRKAGAPVVARDWRVEVERSPAVVEAPAGDRGWVPLRTLLQRIAAQLERWLPRASTGAGVVRFPGGEIAANAAQWERRELRVSGLAYRTLRVDATLAFATDADLLRLTAQTEPTAAVPTTLRAESRGTRVSAELQMLGQPASVSARFEPRGWLPEEAEIVAREWDVPAEKLKLGELYAAARGSAHVAWRAGRFTAEVTARGEPQAGKAAPPLALALRGEGDPIAFTLATFEATLPGITARLSEPVTIARDGSIRGGAARFDFQADLGRQPWFEAKGLARGEARLVSGLAAAPVVEFAIEARDLSVKEIPVTAVEADGRFAWPRVEIARGKLAGAPGEQIAFRGGWDFRTKELLAAMVEGEVRRGSLARWLPAQIEFERIVLTARAEGPVDALRHAGSAQAAGVKAGRWRDVTLAAEWRGTAAKFDEVSLEAGVGVTKISARGVLDPDSLRLSVVEFSTAGTKRLGLVGPAVVRWRPRLQLEGLHLAGGDAVVKVSGIGGESGRVELLARAIPSSWLVDLAPSPGPAWQLGALALTGSWDRGPMTFSASAAASLEIGEGRTAAVMASARGDASGIEVESLRATEGDATVINALGRVPITFSPGATPRLRIEPGGALRLEATVAPHTSFWQKVAAVSGVELQEPEASVHLAGTWQRPEGSAHLKAARIAIDPQRVVRPLPTLAALDLQLTGDRDGVTLNTFAVNVEGQPVRAQGRLPVPEGKWSELFRQPLLVARRGADLRLEVPEADLAVFARFLPALLAPKGRFQADLHYRGGGIEGSVRLRDAATRPLGPLGVLQEISAEVALAGRTLTLRGVTARSGGQPVTLIGSIAVPEDAAPRFDLVLRGENLPFVRQTGLLVRGDLDLKLQTPEGGAPRLSGSVRLRDSLFLADVRAFLPKGGGSSPARRPPYFSVETAPVSTWTLAVDVTGVQFLRLRTPVFAGVATARFRLGGTMREPRAIGEVGIDEGTVRMPFASFAVTQGSIRLTEADPYEPAVYLRATGRRYGYDLAMEIDGPAARPNVVFTSSPALDSEQVLLMVMTGVAPSNEIASSTTQRVANIGLYFGQSLLGSLGADAAEADRLTFVAGEKISNQGKETYGIEYRLSERWTVTGERNEFDEYNAGVKWRLFGGKRPREEKADEKK